MFSQMRKLFGLVASGPVTREYSGGGVMAGNSTVVMVSTDKYTRDMFYLVPFYHREIPPTLTRVIAIDIDLDVR